MEKESPDNHEQFLRLFTANESAILAYVRCLFPTKDDAADIRQGISLVLWDKFRELDDLNGFRSWALAVARYETLAWRRDRARDRLVLADDVLGMIAVDSAQQERRLSAHRDALVSCLKQLPVDKSRPVLGAYEPGVCIQEIAEQSGRTVPVFYQRLHRMRLRLRDCCRRSLEVEGLS